MLTVDEEVSLEDSSISIEIKTYKTPLADFYNGLVPPLPPYVQPPGSPGIPPNNDVTINTDFVGYYSRTQAPISYIYNTPVYGIDGSITVPARSGNLYISAKSLLLSKGAQLETDSSTELNQSAVLGDIDINVRESVRILDSGSGVFSRIGNSLDIATGNIRIHGNSLILKDGGQISTTIEGSASTSNVGNIDLKLDQLLLMQNGGKITASAGKNASFLIPYILRGGISVADLVPGNNATSGGNAGVIGIAGGNIRLEIPDGFIVSKGNSDILANSYFGSGGTVNITTKKAFGLVKRDWKELTRLLNTTSPDELDVSRLSTSDVVAISQTSPNLNGQVNINTLNVDPGRGLERLPAEPRTTDVTDSCQVSNGKEAVQFYDIGRGGLPPRPEDPLSMDLIEWSAPPIDQASPLADKSTAWSQASEPATKFSVAAATRLVPPCQSH